MAAAALLHKISSFEEIRSVMLPSLSYALKESERTNRVIPSLSPLTLNALSQKCFLAHLATATNPIAREKSIFLPLSSDFTDLVCLSEHLI